MRGTIYEDVHFLSMISQDVRHIHVEVVDGKYYSALTKFATSIGARIVYFDLHVFNE